MCVCVCVCVVVRTSRCPLEALVQKVRGATMVSPSLRAFVSSLCLGTKTIAVLKVAKASRCPHSAWQDRIAPLIPTTPSPVLIAVGANKGYPLVDFFRRHAAVEGLDHRAVGRAVFDQ